MEEKMSFMKNGEVSLRLPPGFRFHPTDEELVVQYLRRKVFSRPLPAAIIPEVDLCKADPWDLPGDLEEERYFFTTKEAKYPNGNRSNRATNSGYWKATGLDKQILLTSKSKSVPVPVPVHVPVGMKKTLVFYRGKPPQGSRTNWIMHEYRLLSTSSLPPLPLHNWVICRIFLKRRPSAASAAAKNEEDVKKSTGLVFYDFMAKHTDLNLAPTPESSSSATSGITDNINNNNEQDTSTSNNTFPSSSSFTT